MLEKEKIILKKVSEGDKDAFREIFEYYYPKTRVFLEQFISNVEEAQDLAQNIFIKVWLQRSILVDIRSFGAYLYTVTRNSAIDYGRTRKIKIPLTDMDSSHEQDGYQAESDYFAKETELQIASIIAKQPKKRKQVFVLSRLEGKSNAEISKLMGISKKTVENHLNLVLKEIRKITRTIAIFI